MWYHDVLFLMCLVLTALWRNLCFDFKWWYNVFIKRLEHSHMKSIVWNGNEFSILLRLMNLFYQSYESNENKHDEYFINELSYKILPLHLEL